MKNISVGVLGSGSMGTALVKVLQENDFFVNWYVRRPEVVEYLKNFGNNPDYLSGVEFDLKALHISANLEEIISESDYIIIAIPAAFLHKTLLIIDERIWQEKYIISTIKGIIPEFNQIPFDYFTTFFNLPDENYAILAGPSHAEELVMNKISYLTIGSNNQEFGELLQQFFSTSNIKITTSKDVMGIEYAATLKNIYAIAAGICDGLNYGDNFISVLVVHAIQEMKKFLKYLNTIHRNIISSVYAGDLLVTAFSKFSRNRTFGYLIGKGYGVNYSRIEMKQIAEGYYATKCMKEIVENMKLNMPILETVYKILYKNAVPAREMKKLADQLS